MPHVDIGIAERLEVPKSSMCSSQPQLPAIVFMGRDSDAPLGHPCSDSISTTDGSLTSLSGDSSKTDSKVVLLHAKGYSYADNEEKAPVVGEKVTVTTDSDTLSAAAFLPGLEVNAARLGNIGMVTKISLSDGTVQIDDDWWIAIAALQGYEVDEVELPEDEDKVDDFAERLEVPKSSMCSSQLQLPAFMGRDSDAPLGRPCSDSISTTEGSPTSHSDDSSETDSEVILLEQSIVHCDSDSDAGSYPNADNKEKDGLPEGWKAAIDPKSGCTYYYDVVTRKTQWERPQDHYAVGDKVEVEDANGNWFAAMITGRSSNGTYSLNLDDHGITWESVSKQSIRQVCSVRLNLEAPKDEYYADIDGHVPDDLFHRLLQAAEDVKRRGHRLLQASEDLKLLSDESPKSPSTLCLGPPAEVQLSQPPRYFRCVAVRDYAAEAPGYLGVKVGDEIDVAVDVGMQDGDEGSHFSAYYYAYRCGEHMLAGWLPVQVARRCV